MTSSIDSSTEAALLRKVAHNPFDRGALAVYADFLAENGRAEEEAGIRKALALISKPTNTDVNSMSVGELIALLSEMPLDAPVIYRACSDWCELRPDEVALAKAEDRKIAWREQTGYVDYNPGLWETDAELEARADAEEASTEPLRSWQLPGHHQRQADATRRYRNNRFKGEVPKFVTVCCFPGN